MKAISLWQPWASLWLTDSKIFETRHWPTNHRGLLYVHAAKRRIRESDLTPELRYICEEEFGGHFWNDLPFGAVIGIVNLTDCIPTERMGPGDTGTREAFCGNFASGRFCWERAEKPVHIGPWPYKGRQGLFTISDGALDAVANKELGICSPSDSTDS